MSSWPFRAYKVNSRFEFPLELNLRPYTKEGLDEAEALQQRLRAESGGGGGGGGAASPRESGSGSGSAAPPSPPATPVTPVMPPSLGRASSSSTKEQVRAHSFFLF